MKRKHILTSVLSGCLLLCLVATLAACNEDDTDGGASTSASTTVAETDPETEPATVPETDPETEPATVPETGPETDPETVPETDPATDPTTKPGTDPETDPEPETIPEAQLIQLRKDSMVVAQAPEVVRDPCMLYHDGTYYLYSTGWKYATSTGLDQPFSEFQYCVETPEDYKDCPWAPEVYEYEGKFYMFTTYRSTKNNHRGCAIFVADTPAGPFKPHSDGHVTPADWDAIDGTLYIDEEGQPWMVFVYEWTSTSDGIGRMACAKLSDDLTHFISEPVVLFRSYDAKLPVNQVTDGCFMYRTESGKLLMIWSTQVLNRGYSVLVAESESGEITGPWTHHVEMLYSNRHTKEYDGGHGMIFTDANGDMWMSIHSPNDASVGRIETPVFIPLKEENNTLVWDLERGKTNETP